MLEGASQHCQFSFDLADISPLDVDALRVIQSRIAGLYALELSNVCLLVNQQENVIPLIVYHGNKSSEQVRLVMSDNAICVFC